MKEVRSLSFSMITMFRQCPAKFARVYYHKDPRPLAAAAFEGSLVHDTLEEWMPDRKQDWKAIMKRIMRDKISPYTGKREYEDMTHEQFQGAHDLLREFAKRKDLDVTTEAYELGFDFVLPNGVPINGRIDRVDRMPSGGLNLVDYKTTRTYIWKSEVEGSLQGGMYALAAKYNLFPGHETSFTIDALRYNPITVNFNDDFLAATEDYLENTYNEMQEMYAKLDADPEWVPEYKPNRFCGYCQYAHTCPAIKELSTTVFGEELFPDVHDYARQVIALEEQEKVVKKLAQRYKDRIDSELVAEGKNHKDWGDCFAFYKDYASGPKLQIVDKSGGHTDGN